MSGASREHVQEEHKGMRQRHAKTLGDSNIVEEEGEDQAQGGH